MPHVRFGKGGDSIVMKTFVIHITDSALMDRQVVLNVDEGGFGPRGP